MSFFFEDVLCVCNASLHGEVQETVDKLCNGLDKDRSVLNVGFGLGIVSLMRI